jgi:DNA-binding MurR/RpiR family transcriptional regulator
MPPLLKIRSERDQMSAIERRIADFLLENAHLLRDYSSQQLADALNISQSSVVKFSQKLGFKGYPDLKYSIGEAVARSSGGAAGAGAANLTAARKRLATTEGLWQSKSHAEEETRAINAPDKLSDAAQAIDEAGKVFVLGIGEDGVVAQCFAARLAALGIVVVAHLDLALMAASLASASSGDVLLVISEHGKHATLGQLCRQFRERRCKVISITRNTTNGLRVHADVSLLISAHDDRPHVAALVYQSSLQHVLDLVYVELIEASGARAKRLQETLQRLRQLHED